MRRRPGYRDVSSWRVPYISCPIFEEDIPCLTFEEDKNVRHPLLESSMHPLKDI